jgi:hypothetical protein
MIQRPLEPEPSDEVHAKRASPCPPGGSVSMGIGMSTEGVGDGYVRIYRKMLDWCFYKDSKTKALFLDILLNCQWKARTTTIGGVLVTLNPGQMVFGRKKAALRTGLSEQNVRTALARLARNGTVKCVIHSTKLASILTVCNWVAYQPLKKSTNQPINQALTSLQPTSNQPLTTVQEGKEGKKVKKGKKTPSATTAKTAASQSNITWTPDDRFAGISAADKKEWLEANPACDIDRQLASMHVWLRSNPSKAHKRNWRRFITNWLVRAQERGGDMGSQPLKHEPLNITVEDIRNSLKDR